jgi:hypothetical protein
MAHGSFLRAVAITALAVTGFGCSASHAVGPLDSGAGGDAAAPDASAPDAAAPDGGRAGDAGTEDDAAVEPDAMMFGASCRVLDAQPIICPPSSCDGPPTFFWDGARCFPIGCGECEGADCERGYDSSAECEDAHGECDASLCRATGGDWLFSELYCGHHECGRPGPSICETPTPACNCGATRNFVFGIGCLADDACPPPDPSVDPAGLCTSSGGTWEEVCCPSTCGVPCGAECLAPACTCGPLQIWDELLGCTDSSTCMERGEGEVCTTSTRCGDGMICCQHCGGPGCLPDLTCERPTCDSDPTIDICGNDLLAP